jgi:hypothetical protein
MIQPAPGFRGAHVIVANTDSVFDCRGWDSREHFLSSYAGALLELFPSWAYTLVAIDDPI